jgi:hypothetical protein
MFSSNAVSRRSILKAGGAALLSSLAWGQLDLKARADVADRFYFVPVQVFSPEPGDAFRRPKYFWTSRFERGPITSRVGVMDYGRLGAGFQDIALVLAVDISAADQALMDSHAYNQPAGNQDVYVIPLDYNTNVVDPPGSRAFFEGLGLPTDWLTPSNTYLELMRTLAGMIQFAQRFYGISTVYAWDVQQAGLSYDADSLSDSGQDFSEWEAVTGPAEYKVVMTYERAEGQGEANGYLGAATAATEIAVYRDVDRTMPGWLGLAPDAGAALAYSVQFAVGRILLEEPGMSMDAKYRDFPPYVQALFSASIESFGYDPAIVKPNSDIRQMLRQVGSAWGAQPFWIAGRQF